MRLITKTLEGRIRESVSIGIRFQAIRQKPNKTGKIVCARHHMYFLQATTDNFLMIFSYDNEIHIIPRLSKIITKKVLPVAKNKSPD